MGWIRLERNGMERKERVEGYLWFKNLRNTALNRVLWHLINLIFKLFVVFITL